MDRDWKNNVLVKSAFCLGALKFAQKSISMLGTKSMPETPHEMIQHAKRSGKTCLVVGAGISGIAAVKSCLEDGIEVRCYEATHDCAGFWRYKEDPNTASVYKSVHIDTPRDVNSYGDRPWIDDDAPEFLHNSDICKYLELNVKEFGLDRYIVYGRRVTNITYDKKTNTKWEVTSNDEQGNVFVETFDGVMVATGRHGTSGFQPYFPGMDKSPVEIIHSSKYKYPEKHNLVGKTVVVVGVGNSGIDIVTEVGQVAAKTILVSRSGVWITKLPHGSITMSGSGNGRIATDGFTRLPWWWQSAVIEKSMQKSQAVLNKHGLKPKHRQQQQHLIVTGLHGPPLHDLLEAGKVVVKKNIKSFTEDGCIVFEDVNGSISSCKVDAVVFATGFRLAAGFVDRAVLMTDMDFNRKGNDVPLYQGFLAIPPPNSKFQGAPLGFINFVQTVTFMAAELQSRVYSSILLGNVSLPPPNLQYEHMMRCRNAMAAQFIDREQLRTQHGTVGLMYYDTLAEMIGAKPTFWRLLFERPTALWHWYFGSTLMAMNAVQYRLIGHGAFKNAEAYIEKIFETTLYGTYKSGPLKDKPKDSSHWIVILFRQLGAAAFVRLLLLLAWFRGYRTSSNIGDRLEQNVVHMEETNTKAQHNLHFGDDSEEMKHGKSAKIAVMEHFNKNQSQRPSSM